MTDEVKFSYDNGHLKEEELGHKLKTVFCLFLLVQLLHVELCDLFIFGDVQ